MIQVLLTSSLLILILALLRRVLRGRVSLRLQYALWALVAVRLLIPVSFGSSAVSVLNAVEPVQHQIQAVWSSGDGQPAGTEPAAGAPSAPANSESGLSARPTQTAPQNGTVQPEAPVSAAPSPETAFPLRTVLAAVWLSGVIAMALWFLGVNWTFRRRLRAKARRVELPGCPLPAFVAEGIPSPCLVGLVRPAVYLTPACLDDPVRLRHVLAHELTHCRHRDPWWSLVRCLCLALYWFDPLVWLAASLSRRDCELACDEGALARLGEGQRLAYGRTLVGLMTVSASPARLLQTATTMADRKNGIRERVALIARKPRQLAITVVVVILIVAAAVVCTFTAARQAPADDRPLEERLSDLPQNLADTVTLPQAGTWAEDELAYYYTPDYGTEWGGWMLTVARRTPARFERDYVSYEETGGAEWVGWDGTYYYAILSPTDVNFNPDHTEAYQSAVSALRDWLTETITGQDGMEAFDLSQTLFTDDFSFSGQHMDVYWYPYAPTDGSNFDEETEPCYTLVLSQPVTQGEGGIWCVERWYDDSGYRHFVGPDTELTAEEAYAQAQQAADHTDGVYWGEWTSTSPDLAVSLFLERSFQVSTYTTRTGDPYLADKGAARDSASPTPGSELQAELDRILSGEALLTLTLAGETEGVTRSTADGQSWNGPDARSAWPLSSYEWTILEGDAAAAPADPAYTLTVTTPEGDPSLTFYAGSNSVRCQRGSLVVWYGGTDRYVASGASALGDLLRSNWFDELELDILRKQAAVTVGEEGWPEDAALIPGYVARTLSQRYWEACLQVTPGSLYELADVSVVSARVYDMDAWASPTALAFDQAVAVQGPQDSDLENSIWQAGSGMDRITEGDLAGYWQHYNQCVAQLTDGVWRITEVGTGGYWVEGHDGTNFLPDLLSCSDDMLVSYLFGQADGAYAEGAQYQLGQRFLARPGDILRTIQGYEGSSVDFRPDYQGDGAQWLAEQLAAEFAVFRSGETDDQNQFRALLEEQLSGDYAAVARQVLDAYRQRLTNSVD